MLWLAGCHIQFDANHVKTEIYPLLIGEVSQLGIIGKSQSKWFLFANTCDIGYANFSKELHLCTLKATTIAALNYAIDYISTLLSMYFFLGFINFFTARDRKSVV